jgi:hypothetical protein
MSFPRVSTVSLDSATVIPFLPPVSLTLDPVVEVETCADY